MKPLEDKPSCTQKFWIDNLIKPVFIIMLFIRAEREGDWPLHLLATEMMLPYFFASGHFNYARNGLYYLRSMSKLPCRVLKAFMNGNHVMRHKPGLWNGLWSDLYIETTFMRYGHSPGGIIGITRWALSLHICAQIRNDVLTLSDRNVQTAVTSHK